MPQLPGDAFVSQIASNSIPTTDMHRTVPSEGVSYTQQLTNAHDSHVHNNNVVVQVGEHLVANPPPLVVAPHRDYNTNNWSVHEMLVLQAAKLEFESNLKARNHRHQCHKIREKDVKISSKERWTWIENACWNAGVFRSQKQCHDKWEGVTTQFRKVTRFNEKIKILNNKNSDSSNVVEDYWSMSQLARKHNKLPANFSREVFNALRKNHFGGGGETDPASDYSTLRLNFTSNHHVDGEDDAARGSSARPPNKKRKLETSDEEGLEGIAAAIVSAVEKADERHKELMEFERAKFEFEKEKLHEFANLGNGVMRVLIDINEVIRERLNSDCATTPHGKS